MALETQLYRPGSDGPSGRDDRPRITTDLGTTVTSGKSTPGGLPDRVDDVAAGVADHLDGIAQQIGRLIDWPPAWAWAALVVGVVISAWVV